jgi:ABC-type polysaccharide/polyol phosphate transport system ATPase subunit
MAAPLIAAQGLTKVYPTYPSPWDRLWEALTRRPRHRLFHALSDVSFTLPRGEGLAVIGENGAGKSTLLKILAGITAPTTGTAKVDGRVAAILELGSGFHPELTGRQNIVLNAAMLGLSDAEVRAATPHIIEFSELGEHIDQPVKFYSTGMAMRLGFSIATQVDPDVLIIDEALSVGDGYFQKKCMDRIVDFLEGGGTLLFCSHAMYYVSAFCKRALWLRDGCTAALGPAEAVIREYETYLLAKSAAQIEPEPIPPPTSRPARLEVVRPIDRGASGSPGQFRHRDPWGLEVEWTAEDERHGFHLAVGIDRADGVQVVAMSSFHDGLEPFRDRTRYRVELLVPELPLLSGSFHLQVFLLDEAALHVYDQRRLRRALEVEAAGYAVGLIETPHRWRIEPPPVTAAVAPLTQRVGV